MEQHKNHAVILRSIANKLLEIADQMDATHNSCGGATEEFFFTPPNEKRDDNYAYNDLNYLKSIAKYQYNIRRTRDHFFDPDLFGEAAWDIMLDLFIAKIDGKSTTVKSSCVASSVPQTTALRWLQVLEEFGLVARTRNPIDGRSSLVEFTELGFTSMKSYLRLVARRTISLQSALEGANYL